MRVKDSNTDLTATMNGDAVKEAVGAIQRNGYMHHDESGVSIIVVPFHNIASVTLELVG